MLKAAIQLSMSAFASSTCSRSSVTSAYLVFKVGFRLHRRRPLWPNDSILDTRKSPFHGHFHVFHGGETARKGRCRIDARLASRARALLHTFRSACCKEGSKSR